MKDLGPPLLKVKNTNIVRTDIEIVGARNHKIYCSHYEPLESERKWNIMPCVIYCHGNSSSRIEAKELVTYLLPENITLFCFDFPGCGKSEGEYISLGHYEQDEINVLVDFLRSARKVSTVALWGRSMGAATSLLHAN